MKLRRLKNGRIKDMDTGLFVNKKLAKSFANGKKIPLLKSTKRSRSRKAKKINYPNKRASKVYKIRYYNDGSYLFPSFDYVGQELYVAETLKQDAIKHINSKKFNR